MNHSRADFQCPDDGAGQAPFKLSIDPDESFEDPNVGDQRQITEPVSIVLTQLELGPAEVADFGSHPELSFKLLRLSHATHDGTPARVAEFGIDAPRSIPIRRGESL